VKEMSSMPEERSDKRLMVAGLVAGFLVIGVALMLVAGVFSQ
jgi:hypothetical protein